MLGFIGFLLYLFFLFSIIRAVVKAGKKQKGNARQLTPEQISQRNARIEAMRERTRKAREQQKANPEPEPETREALSGEGYGAPSMAYGEVGEGFGTQGESAQEHEAHLMRGAIQGENAAQHEAHIMHGTPQGEPEPEHAAHMNAAGETGPVRKSNTREPYFRDAADLRRAVVAREILDPPLALRHPRG